MSGVSMLWDDDARVLAYMGRCGRLELSRVLADPQEAPLLAAALLRVTGAWEALVGNPQLGPWWALWDAGPLLRAVQEHDPGAEIGALRDIGDALVPFMVTDPGLTRAVMELAVHGSEGWLDALGVPESPVHGLLVMWDLLAGELDDALVASWGDRMAELEVPAGQASGDALVARRVWDALMGTAPQVRRGMYMPRVKQLFESPMMGVFAPLCSAAAAQRALELGMWGAQWRQLLDWWDRELASAGAAGPARDLFWWALGAVPADARLVDAAALAVDACARPERVRLNGGIPAPAYVRMARYRAWWACHR